MNSVGDSLMRARLAKGLDLASVAALTKISVRYLEAIEADDRKSLPSGFFYKSFIHQYAGVLGLDTRELDAEIERVLAAEAPPLLPGQEIATGQVIPQVKVAPSFNKPRAFASMAALMLVVLGCSGIYAWWRKTQSAEARTIAQVTAPAVVEKPQGKQQPPPQKSVEQPVEQKATDPEPAPPAAEQKSDEQKPAEQPPAEQPRAELASAPATLESALQTAKDVSPSDKASDASENRVVLDLLAHENTWLSVSSDGKHVFTGVLGPNQSKTVAGKEYAKMTVGNAAGLEVRLNGKSIGPLGEHGQVLVLMFTRDNFQIVSAAMPKAGD